MTGEGGTEGGLEPASRNIEPLLGAFGGNLFVTSFAFCSKVFESQFTASSAVIVPCKIADLSCALRGPFKLCATFRNFVRYSFVFSSG